MKHLLRIVVVLLVVLLPHTYLFPFNTYSLLILLIVWLFLRYDSSRFSDIGFSTSGFSLRLLGVGMIVGGLVVVFSQLVFYPLLDLLVTFPEVEVDMYNEVRGNTIYYIIMLSMGWLIGGFYEEIVFHGFIFNQIKKLLGGKYTVPISFLITNVMFGLYHLQLGYADTLNAFMAGCIYHLLALQFRGNLWASIICHGTYNSIVITMLYLGSI